MTKQYAHLHTMAKTSVKFQNNWPKTVGGVALTRHALSIVDGRVTARLYRTCIARRCNKKHICWLPVEVLIRLTHSV